MAMPTSGAISIGMARDECQQGNPINAGNPSLSRLAGVSQGQGYRWSDWYGKSYLRPINREVFCTILGRTDQKLWTDINLLDGSNAFKADKWDNQAGRPYVYTPYLGSVPLLGLYSYVNFEVVQTGGRETVDLRIVPTAANGWHAQVMFTDWQGGADKYSCTCYLTALP